ncbi:MAG: DUF4405 domain-containing protein [Candidatus Thorarchaeota archaeon]
MLKFLNLYVTNDNLSYIAALLSGLHYWSGIILAFPIALHLFLHWKWIVRSTRNLFKSKHLSRRKLNYFIDIGLLISFILVLITGILKSPLLNFTRTLNYTSFSLLMTLHDWSGLFLLILAIFHVILHLKWMIAMTKRLFSKKNASKLIIVTLSNALILALVFPYDIFIPTPNEPTIYIGDIRIDDLDFNPDEIETIRPDLFKNGSFSVFDLLIYLDTKRIIELQYHFALDMDTYVIDSINRTTNWWYQVWYHKGWPEPNVFRMDHYPYKPKMNLRLYQTSNSHLQKVFNSFREEVTRLQSNNGNIIIPQVIIKTERDRMYFYDVEVVPHNLRNDMLQNDVITALDVILTLGDAGLISYGIYWADTIGTAEFNSYFVLYINGSHLEGKCGFVYEAGDWEFEDVKGNHIHIPSDICILTSPEYEKWFYGCL